MVSDRWQTGNQLFCITLFLAKKRFNCVFYKNILSTSYFRYRPRSNPDGYGITAHCVDWTDGGTKGKPEIEIKYYDGQNWEECMESGGGGITEHSKA